MEPRRDLAIVLKSIPYEDRHRIVIALTERNGQITALARNSIQSRRFGGSLDLFVASDWHFTLKPGANLYHLSETWVREPFDDIRKSFEKLTLASIFSELALKAASPQGRGQEGEMEGGGDLFRLHSNALFALNECTQTNFELPLLNAYIAKLLQWSGNQPRLHSCLECGILLQSIAPHISVNCLITNASWVCLNCSTVEPQQMRRKLSALVMRDFQLSLSMPIRQWVTQCNASLSEHRELLKFLEVLSTYHIPGLDKKPLNSLRFLDLKSTLPLQTRNLQ